MTYKFTITIIDHDKAKTVFNVQTEAADQRIAFANVEKMMDLNYNTRKIRSAD